MFADFKIQMRLFKTKSSFKIKMGSPYVRQNFFEVKQSPSWSPSGYRPEMLLKQHLLFMPVNMIYFLIWSALFLVGTPYKIIEWLSPHNTSFPLPVLDPLMLVVILLRVTTLFSIIAVSYTHLVYKT